MTALTATQLTRQFGGLKAVNQVSLTLRRGEIHALIGPNGAGKSTLVQLLSGELAPHAGRIEMGGQNITAWSPARRARAGLGRTYQRTTVFPTLSVFENCRLCAQGAQPRSWARWWQGADLAGHAAAMAALHAVGLADHLHRLAQQLSHGHQRQLELAMCLSTQPRVLLLDEPLAGMGAEESERMLALLTPLKATHAVLLVEHDMDAVFRVADRITVMVEGEVLASGTPEQVRQNAAVQSAYLGHAA